VINIKRVQFNLLQGKQEFEIMIIGFREKDYYGEVYFKERGGKTYVHRGSDLKLLIKRAKMESCLIES
jgi:tRNA A-37 threonylcarbamoyl transferase component Bud32